MATAKELKKYTKSRADALQKKIENNCVLFDTKQITFKEYDIATIILSKEYDYLISIKEILDEI